VTQKKKPTPTPIHVDGFDLLWTLARDTQWSSRDDYLGITITVCQAGPARKELILKYPFLGVKPNGKWHIPERPKVTPQIVEAGIREAMAAGWSPNSRGKAFTWFVEEATDHE
jgi:hypothetical protein